MVTVIAADDPNSTFGRRRVQRHPEGGMEDASGQGGSGTLKKHGGGGGGYPAGQK